jgi:hypothetical protein
MTRTRIAFAAFAATILFAAPQPLGAQAATALAKAEKPMSALEKGAYEMERAAWDALKNHDWTTFDNLVAGETSMDNSGITAVFKKGVVGPMLQDLVTNSYTLSDMHARTLAPNVVLITYKVDYDQTFGGVHAPSPSYSMSIWKRKGGKWTALAHAEAVAKDAK